MSKRVYARAEVMIANPFRESGSDLLMATLSLVVSPMVFVHRVSTNKAVSWWVLSTLLLVRLAILR